LFVIVEKANVADESDKDFALKLVGEGISIHKKVSGQVAMAVVVAVLGCGAAAAASGAWVACVQTIYSSLASPGSSGGQVAGWRRIAFQLVGTCLGVRH
jgi:hypothetical protein